jgi:hypothetical protein
MSNDGLRLATNLLVAGALFVGGLLLLLPRDLALRLTREGGVVESLAVLVASIGVAGAGLKLIRCRNGIWGAITLMLLWIFLRELDYQKLFTPRSIESIGFYSNPAIPLQMKLAAIAALSPFVLAALYLASAGLRELRTAGGRDAVWWRPIGFAGALLVGALGAEKLLPRPGRIIEEIFELAFISLLVLVIAHRTWPAAGAAQTAPDTADQPGPGERS